jgi:Bacteriophage Mu Gam like protein
MTDVPLPMDLPPPPSPRLEADRLVRLIASHESALERVRTDAAAQRAEIDAWLASEERLHESTIAQIKARLVPLIDAELAQNPLRRRSVPLPSGTAGYRTPPAKLVVDDPDALVSWAEQHHPDWLRHPPPEPAIQVIKRETYGAGDGTLCAQGQEPGEFVPVPGCRMVRKEPQFFVTVGRAAE